MKGALKKLTIAIVCTSFTIPSYTQSNDIYIIKDRIINQLLRMEINNASIASLIEAMNEDSSFKDIDY